MSYLMPEDYRMSMDGPMENLSAAIWGVDGDGGAGLKDWEIVEYAARKIEMLRQMVIAAGVPAGVVEAAIRE